LLKGVKGICIEVDEAAPHLVQMVEEARKRVEEQHRKWLAEPGIGRVARSSPLGTNPTLSTNYRILFEALG
jgi:hypothetical protein